MGARWLAVLAASVLACAHAGGGKPDPRARQAWEQRFQAFVAGLPACPAALPAITVEEARSHRWPPGACLLVRGRLRLLAELPPCGDPENTLAAPPGTCRVSWALWSELPPPGSSAVPRGFAVWNDLTAPPPPAPRPPIDQWDEDSLTCEERFGRDPWYARMSNAVLPYPIDDPSGAVARATRSEAQVALLGTIPVPRLTPVPLGLETESDLPDSPRYNPPELPTEYDLAVAKLGVARICRLDTAATR